MHRWLPAHLTLYRQNSTPAALISMRYAGLSNERLGGWGVCGVAFRSAKQSASELFVPAVLIPFFACPYLDRIGGLGAGLLPE